MKLKQLLLVGALSCVLGLVGQGSAAESSGTNPSKPKDAKPYTLKTCLVSGDKLGGDMGKPYVFVYKGQEIQLCCKGCVKDFDKEPAKYIKKLESAKADSKGAAPTSPDKSHGDHQH